MIQRINYFSRGFLILLSFLLYRLEKNVETIWKNEERKGKQLENECYKILND